MPCEKQFLDSSLLICATGSAPVVESGWRHRCVMNPVTVGVLWPEVIIFERSTGSSTSTRPSVRTYLCRRLQVRKTECSRRYSDSNSSFNCLFMYNCVQWQTLFSSWRCSSKTATTELWLAWKPSRLTTSLSSQPQDKSSSKATYILPSE